MNARQMIELAARRIQKVQPGATALQVAARIGHLLLVGLSDEIFATVGRVNIGSDIDRGRIRLAKALGLKTVEDLDFDLSSVADFKTDPNRDPLMPKGVNIQQQLNEVLREGKPVQGGYSSLPAKMWLKGYRFDRFGHSGRYTSSEIPELTLVIAWNSEKVMSVSLEWESSGGVTRKPRVDATNISTGLLEVLALSQHFHDFPLLHRQGIGEDLQKLNEILRDSEPLKEGDPEDPDDPQLGKVGDAPKRTQTLFEHIGKSGMRWWFLHLPDKGPTGETLVFDGRNYKPVLKFKAENQKRILLTKSASSEQWGDIEVAMKDLSIFRQEEPKRPSIYNNGRPIEKVEEQPEHLKVSQPEFSPRGNFDEPLTVTPAEVKKCYEVWVKEYQESGNMKKALQYALEALFEPNVSETSTQEAVHKKLALLGRRMVEELDKVWGPPDTQDENGKAYLVDMNVEEPEDYVLVLGRLIEMAQENKGGLG